MIWVNMMFVLAVVLTIGGFIVIGKRRTLGALIAVAGIALLSIASVIGNQKITDQKTRIEATAK